MPKAVRVIMVVLVVLAGATRASAATLGETVIVFIGDNYGPADRAIWDADVSRHVSEFFAREPYTTQLRAETRVIALWNTRDLGCRPPSNRLIFCDNTAIVRALYDAGIGDGGRDQVHVIVRGVGYGGAGGAPISTAYARDKGPKVTSHELGHALCDAADEYPQYSTPVVLDGRLYRQCFKGTGVSSDPLWEGVRAEDVRDGCGWPNIRRPKPSSRMRSLDSPEFNLPTQRLCIRKHDTVYKTR